MDQAETVPLGEITATLPAESVLYPWHQFALNILSTAVRDRPVYFASSGNAANALGVGNQIVRHGLAFKLHERPLPDTTGASGVVPTPQTTRLFGVIGPYVAPDRTATLVDSVFFHRSGLPDWDHWPDASTLGIPNYSAWAYWALAQTAFAEGNEEATERYQRLGDAWATLGN